MATKIVLLSANRHKDPYAVYPLGTAYLKSHLLHTLNDCEVTVLDMNRMTELELGTRIRDYAPDYTCVSIRNVDGANSLDQRGFINDYIQITETVRKNTSSPIIIGGAGFSIFPEIFMKELNADYGIKGEGEEPLRMLIEALRNNASTQDIPALYNKEGKNKKTYAYIKTPTAHYEADLAEYYWRESGMLNIQTKRGCPYDCIYCTYPIIDGSMVRTVPIDSIIETIAKAKKDFGANYWFFTDSVFNIHDRYNIELAEALAKSKLDISWGAYFSPRNIVDDQMALFKASGLTHIEFGTESFCDETLEAYGKRFTFDDVILGSEIALKHNVFYSHFLILAGWGETKERLHTTIANSKHLKHTVIFPYVGMRIYPNTTLRTRAINDGVLSKDHNLMEPQYFITEGFDLEQTKALAATTGKAWVFPDAPQEKMLETLKYKRNKKGPLWEYLRKP